MSKLFDPGELERLNGKNTEEQLGHILGVFAGAASTCWENLEGAGEFHSERASELTEEVKDLILQLFRPQFGIQVAPALGLQFSSPPEAGRHSAPDFPRHVLG